MATFTHGRFTVERLSASTYKIVQDDGATRQYPFMYAILGVDKCVVIDTGVGTGGLKQLLDLKVRGGGGGGGGGGLGGTSSSRHTR